MNSVIIDIREHDEFQSEYIADSIHIPMGEFQSKIADWVKNLGKREIILMCRSGRRAQLVFDQVTELNLKNLTVYPGGILEWKRQGKPVVTKKKSHFPIMRQVQLVTGVFILASVALTLSMDLRWIGLAGFIGVGLTIAGATGFCGMAKILTLMPWNRIE